jgi:hypothetical protein
VLKSVRARVVLLVVLIALTVGGVLGFYAALGVLKGKVVEALGEGAEIGAIGVGWSGVTVSGLRLPGPKGWPAQDALRAEEIVIVPSLGKFLVGEVRAGSVRVVRPYLSALRSPDGRLRLLPSLLEAPAKGGASPPGGKAGPPAPSVTIGTVTLEEGVVELYDATVATPPLKIRLEAIRATIREIALPAQGGKTEIDIAGLVKGAARDGRFDVKGWVEIATRDSSVQTTLRAVDLVPLQPYLGKGGTARLHRGLLDLDLTSEIRKNRLKAPGTVTLAELEFAPGEGAGSFLGLPRDAVLGVMKGKDGRIALKFVLEGDVSDPRFSLNEAFSTRMAAGLADSLGVSVRGLAQEAGSLGGKAADAVGQAAKGIGGSLGKLFGGSQKK